MLLDMLTDVLEVDNESSSTSESFADANESECKEDNADEWQIPCMAKLGEKKEKEEWPPPQLPPWQLDSAMYKWVDNVCDTIYDTSTNNDNVNTYKPTIAKLVFNYPSQYMPITDTLQSDHDHIPIYCQKNK
jgi:hypothetical protein